MFRSGYVFFPPVAAFILEAERRHPRQQVKAVNSEDGQWVDYQLDLPERSLNEFYRWVNRFMEAAMFLAPQALVKRHQQAAAVLSERYL